MQKKAQGIQLIVGLGNPGAEYANTRHNVGFWFVQAVCRLGNISLRSDAKFKGEIAQLNSPTACRLLQPTTFMNLSGQSVKAVSHFYKIPPEAILVVHDDLDLPPGTVRIKRDGGHGGHNGLRDIINHLGTRSFFRLRLGIGHPGNKEEVHNFVLKKPSISDNDHIEEAIHQAIDALPLLLTGDIDKAMQRLHSENNGKQ